MAARRTTKKADAAPIAAPAETPDTTTAAATETAAVTAAESTPAAAPREDLQLLVARSLFRADKWDPARDANAPFEWDPQRADYLARSARLLRILDKDGMEIVRL